MPVPDVALQAEWALAWVDPAYINLSDVTLIPHPVTPEMPFCNFLYLGKLCRRSEFCSIIWLLQLHKPRSLVGSLGHD